MPRHCLLHDAWTIRSVAHRHGLENANILPGTVSRPILQQHERARARYNMHAGAVQLPATETFDYVIMGGVAARSIMPNRLSDSPTMKILLLEASREATEFAPRMILGFSWSALLLKFCANSCIRYLLCVSLEITHKVLV